MGRKEDRQPLQRMVEAAKIDTSWFRARKYPGTAGTKGPIGALQMKREQALSEKRKWTRSPALLGALTLGVLIVFFGAPIIPVEGSYTVSDFCRINYQYSYKDWQSLVYYLLNIGYHYRVFLHSY